MNTVVSQQVKALLDQHKLSESELARRIKIPRPTLNRLVAGKMHSPKMHVLQAIADYFTCEVSSLIHYHAPAKTSQASYVPWGMLATCEQTQTLKVETQHAIPDYAILTQCHADTNPLTNQTLWLVVQAKSKPRDGQWVLVYHPPSQAIVWCTIHIQGSSIELHPLDQKTNRLTPSQIHWIGVITSTHTSL